MINSLAQTIDDHVKMALELSKGNVTQAKNLLQVNRNTVSNYIRKFVKRGDKLNFPIDKRHLK